jgi:peptidoglycan/xylan/chitin deacetylase (PgdA/CDA1 family)
MEESVMNKMAVAQQAKASSFLPPGQGLLQSKCACGNHTVAGGECAKCAKKKGVLQRKLAIGASNDPPEQEADRMADQVMAASAYSSVRGAPLRIQRFSEQADGRMEDVPVSVNRVLAGSGRALEPALRETMEQRFDHDFSTVRVHAGHEAAESAREVSARAYTIGSEIIFGEGNPRLDTPSGQRLLAHELAHIVQQSLSDTHSRQLGSRTDPDEQQAERVVDAFGWGGFHRHYGDVASNMTLHADARARPVLPRWLPAGARIQRVQLTYDDGPDSAGNTRSVLNSLNTAGARATFYLVGKRVAQGDNWRIVFDIAAAGHWLGNHAYDWNDATDNHIFLSGTSTERAEKILQTEWAIRDALVQGSDEAKKNKSWDSIPQPNRDYIMDVIAHGTGRFRTPGFRSKPWSKDGSTTLAAIASVNSVLAATGLRPISITELSKWGPDYEGVTVDPEDWRSGRTQSDVESAVKGGLSSNADSILLHSRLKATAAATPAILSAIKSKKWTFDPTVQGALGSKTPKPPFADLSTISNPPTSAEVAKARAWLQKHMISFGPYISGAVAIGIFQMAQQAGSAEVNAFAAEIKATKVKTPDGEIPMANWMNVNPEWGIFANFFENWMTNKPFPRIKGITI